MKKVLIIIPFIIIVLGVLKFRDGIIFFIRSQDKNYVAQCLDRCEQLDVAPENGNCSVNDGYYFDDSKNTCTLEAKRCLAYCETPIDKIKCESSCGWSCETTANISNTNLAHLEELAKNNPDQLEIYRACLLKCQQKCK